MDKNDGSDGLKFNAMYLVQTTEDVARALLAAASVATVQPARPSVVHSSREENNSSPLHKLQQQVSKMWKGFSSPPEVSRPYNPEVLTTQKRQWSRFQLKSLDNRCIKEPSKLFESIAIVGLHPQADVRELENIIPRRNDDDVKRARNIFNNNHHQVHAVSNLEPQVLFAYPPEKPLPLKYKDLLSFCLPGGVQVHAVERTPSFSELNEILLGQEQLKESNQSFVFRLQVADDSTLYGCCVLVEEIVQRPSKLVAMLIGEKPSFPHLSRYVLTTPRCYCILSRLPFFDLHFGVLQSILMEERLEWLTEGFDMLNMLSPGETCEEDDTCKSSESTAEERYFGDHTVNLGKNSESGAEVSSKELSDYSSSSENRENQLDSYSKEVIRHKNSYEVSQQPDDFGAGKVTQAATPEDTDIGIEEDSDTKQTEILIHEPALVSEIQNDIGAQESCDNHVHEVLANGQSDISLDRTVLPLLRCCLFEGSESSPSFQDSSPSEDRNFRCDTQEIDLEEPSSIGHGDLVGHDSISQWAKAKKYGSLQIICEYYQLQCPVRGSSLTFQPLEHLHPLRFHRPGEALLHIAGSSIDLRSCDTSLEAAEMRNALFTEEESTALSVWAIACVCGCLRLEHVMTLFAAALLEKQIVIVCSNLGMLSASVLSVIPLIRPYQWQSLLVPVLPDDMLDFLDAPVPYIVGVQNKTADVQSRLAHAIIVDANKNQIRSASIPQLPQQRELLSSLRPYHSRLVGESYLARKRPVYECTDAQVEAAKAFLAVLRSYIDSFCSNLRSHTITNVQTNNDKVSLLLKDSFIGSFPSRDRPFMKLFVDTQLFSVHSDLVLSFYQKD